MNKKVLVPVADGTEELEAVTIVDILRRARADVVIASVESSEISASRGVTIKADKIISECADEEYDLIALPGGMPGAEKLRDSELLAEMLRIQSEQGRLYAAICASPAVVFLHHGLLKDRRATCHPAFKDEMPVDVYLDESVVESGNCVTSQGPGTAMEFALKLVELLYDRDTARGISETMCVGGMV